MIEYVQHRALFVDAHLEAHEHGNVAYDHSEAYGNEQQGLPMLHDTQGDENQPYDYHDDMSPGGVRETRERPELLKAL